MSFFDVLNLIGGLSLFLFGMHVMGTALEKRAGGQLKALLGKLTGSRLAGFLTGLGVTAVIQSSSATTVMVVGFVNSGLMTLKQAIHVIMGANVGTTVTAWLLSLAGLDGSSLFIQLLKPSSFTPVLALVGIVLIMAGKERQKDTGSILLGFAVLMYGMEAMSGAVSPLRTSESFRSLLLLFSNPILGVLAGAVFTAIIQSSSASVGVLQALASTGAITMASAIPIIMGQNIGTCVTAMLSSIGANTNAKRAALVHLSFNIIDTAVMLVAFCAVRAMLQPAFLSLPATAATIAVAHSLFNIVCTAILMPASGLLEKLSIALVPDKAAHTADGPMLDERLLATPAIAVERCRVVALDMAQEASDALNLSIESLTDASPALGEKIRALEDSTDRYEDTLGTYLLTLAQRPMTANDSDESGRLLHLISDFERIADHAVNILESAEELHAKKITLPADAQQELTTLEHAVQEIIRLSLTAFRTGDLSAASRVEPLEQVIDGLKGQLRTRQIARLQKGACSLETGFIWTDLLTNFERVATTAPTLPAACSKRAQESGPARVPRRRQAERTGVPPRLRSLQPAVCTGLTLLPAYSKRTAGFPAVRLFSVTAFHAYSRGMALKNRLRSGTPSPRRYRTRPAARPSSRALFPPYPEAQSWSRRYTPERFPGCAMCMRVSRRTENRSSAAGICADAFFPLFFAASFGSFSSRTGISSCLPRNKTSAACTPGSSV